LGEKKGKVKGGGPERVFSISNLLTVLDCARSLGEGEKSWKKEKKKTYQNHQMNLHCLWGKKEKKKKKKSKKESSSEGRKRGRKKKGGTNLKWLGGVRKDPTSLSAARKGKKGKKDGKKGGPTHGCHGRGRGKKKREGGKERGGKSNPSLFITERNCRSRRGKGKKKVRRHGAWEKGRGKGRGYI